MNKENGDSSISDDDDMLPEYDFRKMIRVDRSKFQALRDGKDPTVRITHRDGTIETGTLAEMKKKYECRTGILLADERAFTIMAIPNRCVSDVRELVDKALDS